MALYELTTLDFLIASLWCTLIGIFAYFKYKLRVDKEPHYKIYPLALFIKLSTKAHRALQCHYEGYLVLSFKVPIENHWNLKTKSVERKTRYERTDKKTLLLCIVFVLSLKPLNVL